MVMIVNLRYPEPNDRLTLNVDLAGRLCQSNVDKDP